MTLLEDASHRRLNPLTREWVLVSPHRTQRPWRGQTERPARPAALRYDPDCYLCPGARRAHGDVNPDYPHTFVFANDFAALRADAGAGAVDRGGLIVAEAESGLCRVICFSPRHDLTLARMTVEEIERVVRVWIEQTRELGGVETIGWVQIFENRGAMMGASNPHPHCQIWATQSLPNEAAKELASQTSHRAERRGCLLCDYLALELASSERVVEQNEHFVALVPFWAVWPFETLLLPRRHFGAMDELSEAEARGLADILRALTIRYDNLFEIAFPYSMGFHQSPTDGAAHPEWHFHAHFYPPLLRSATVRKFMVGFEMLATPQRDITPESAAERLRETPAAHYLDRSEDPAEARR
ncbi:MAG: UDP-glucose--hexose-1-phosphate uridylyltransferase [Roseiarcus sp.]|jgi:UDPglucose--hexose-1-phosphate uridylyltransferase